MTISRYPLALAQAFFEAYDLPLLSAPVRALAWSCFAPPLISSDDTSSRFPLTPRRRAWLLDLERNDLPLRAYLAEHCHSRRLGLVYESLWHFFLDQDPACQLIAHNIPVRDETGRSLGEFDVLYRDMDTGNKVHLELAIKFFLEQPLPDPGTPLSRWLGPNSADRLDIKLDRLHHHQLPLAQTPEGKRSLLSLGVDQFSSHFRIGGMLFYRNNGSEIIAARPTDQLNQQHLYGDWVTAEEVDDLEGWRHLAKPDWLSARYADAQTISVGKVKEIVSKRPIMLINTDGARRFVVDRNWPASITGR